MAAAESLNVIALISGGKDSFFSILHCLQNGHRVVALANLYPSPLPLGEKGAGEEEEDLNSFMFQTVGHTVIPLYEQALGIPLYRQPIVGGAVHTGTSYSCSQDDETESLVPLLQRVMSAHPEANALSTGAILSTYQRTRVESVAGRLGLIPLAFLWQYPVLPPRTQTALLQDMQAVGLEARIVKVASGGLDESFLWEDVGSGTVVRRLERAMRRFGSDGDGAVLGEGGEFETLVVDGPRDLFKGRIEIREEDRRVVREGGGAAWLRFLDARVVMKSSEEESPRLDCRIPDLLEPKFAGILENLEAFGKDDGGAGLASSIDLSARTPSYSLQLSDISSPGGGGDGFLYWTIAAERKQTTQTISEEAAEIMAEVRRRLSQLSLEASDITSTMIILRSMEDFVAVNKVYGALFTKPNPPARVTISCGFAMPHALNIILHLKILNPSSSPPPSRSALHVQSRSYWAPANIGPYSQATSTTLSPGATQISIAGQIPLLPSSMSLPGASSSSPLQDFSLQATLALQHLFRIAFATSTRWLPGAIAYLPVSTSLPPPPLLARLLSRTWTLAHEDPTPTSSAPPSPTLDLWAEKHDAAMRSLGREERPGFPDPGVCEGEVGAGPVFVVVVQELPRGAMVEWHALGGVGGEGLKLTTSIISTSNFQIHKTQSASSSSSSPSHTIIISLPYNSSSNPSTLSQNLSLALSQYQPESQTEAGRTQHLFIDVGILEEIGDDIRMTMSGFVPCWSIWNAEGERLGAVLVFLLEG